MVSASTIRRIEDAEQRMQGLSLTAEGGLSPAGLQYRREVAPGVRYGGRGQSTIPVPPIAEIKPEVPPAPAAPVPAKLEKLEDVKARFRRGSAYKMEEQLDALRLLEERMRGRGGRGGRGGFGRAVGSGALWRNL